MGFKLERDQAGVANHAPLFAKSSQRIITATHRRAACRTWVKGGGFRVEG